MVPPGSPPLFDQVVVVDWSASAGRRRGPDSLWVCAVPTGSATDGADPWDGERLENPPTRHEMVEFLETLVTTESAGRTLLTIDVALGYPSGTAAALGLTAGPSPWHSTCSLIGSSYVESPNNRPDPASDRWALATELNRRLVEGGHGLHFWGCPPRRASNLLTTTRPHSLSLATHRRCEEVLRRDGLRPFSPWQLLGAGAVGSQTLTAIAALEVLRSRLAAAGVTSTVWPFETGLAAPRRGSGEPTVVIAEIWPTMLPAAEVDGCVTLHGQYVKDARQVSALARSLARLDVEGALTPLFDPLPANDPDRHAIIEEEGWVLGVVDGGPTSDLRPADGLSRPRAPRHGHR